jgi:hypothetical protein
MSLGRGGEREERGRREGGDREERGWHPQVIVLLPEQLQSVAKE